MKILQHFSHCCPFLSSFPDILLLRFSHYKNCPFKMKSWNFQVKFPHTRTSDYQPQPTQTPYYIFAPLGLSGVIVLPFMNPTSPAPTPSRFQQCPQVNYFRKIGFKNFTDGTLTSKYRMLQVTIKIYQILLRSIGMYIEHSNN